MHNFRFTEKLSLLVILGALTGAGVASGHWPPRPDSGLHKAIGLRLARQALDLCGATGQILVITRDTEAFPQPALELLLSSFQREVKRASGKPAALRRLQVDPLRPLEIPAGDFLELLRRGQAGQVLVSLLGPPLLSEEQWSQARPIKPKIVAFCPGSFVETMDLGRLFDSGFLHAAVVSRPVVAETTVNTGHSPRTLDQLYMTVTTLDRSQLSSSATPNP
jgi:hypothetical protein